MYVGYPSVSVRLKSIGVSCITGLLEHLEQLFGVVCVCMCVSVCVMWESSTDNVMGLMDN